MTRALPGPDTLEAAILLETAIQTRRRISSMNNICSKRLSGETALRKHFTGCFKACGFLMFIT